MLSPASRAARTARAAHANCAGVSRVGRVIEQYWPCLPRRARRARRSWRTGWWPSSDDGRQSCAARCSSWRRVDLRIDLRASSNRFSGGRGGGGAASAFRRPLNPLSPGAAAPLRRGIDRGDGTTVRDLHGQGANAPPLPMWPQMPLRRLRGPGRHHDVPFVPPPGRGHYRGV